MEILLLGDSTSFTGGWAGSAYPAHLADMAVWKAGSRMINPSVAGFTSADAYLYFSDYLKENRAPDAVLVFLGNCDACATHWPKGQPTPFRRYLTKFLKLFRPASRRNLFRPYTFDPNYRHDLEHPEKVTDFSANLRRIIATALKRDAKVVLVSPVANTSFVAGSGKGNFIFYDVFGLDSDCLPYCDAVPPDLEAPLRAACEGDKIRAKDLYRELLDPDGPPSVSGQEVRQIAANNLAVLLAEEGAFDQALALLDKLIGQPGARREIALFNQSRICRAAGQIDRADMLQEKAFNTDASMYRIRQVYRDALRKLAEDFPAITHLDMADHVSDTDFVDHCHVMPTAQAKLATRLAAVLAPLDPGTDQLTLVSCPMTPEYSIGNKHPLADFLYRLRNNSDDQRQKAALRIAEAAGRHPLFNDGTEIDQRPPIHDFELGRFPDVYLTRLLAPYLSAIRSDAEQPQFAEVDMLPSLEARLSILPGPVKSTIMADAGMPVDGSAERIERVKRAVIDLLTQHLTAGPSIGLRYRSTIYWYFKESVKFGSPSRWSMLYQRSDLDAALEGVLGVRVLALALGHEEHAWCDAMVQLISAIICAHEEAGRRWLENYRKALGCADPAYGRDRNDLLKRLQLLGKEQVFSHA